MPKAQKAMKSYKKNPISTWPRAKAMYAQCTGAPRSLMQKIFIAAENMTQGHEHVQKTADWVESGGTIRLREVCGPFGDYWGDTDFANLVDQLDAVSARTPSQRL